MVQLTEELVATELNNSESRDQCRVRRPKAARRHSRPMKAKKGNWNTGMQRRRNKRFAW